MRPMTIKEALRKVRKTFIEQEKPRCRTFDNVGPCDYWLPDKPHGCAVGCLMPLKARKAAASACLGWVSGSSYGPLVRLAPRLRGLPVAFLARLQMWHDNGGTAADFEAIEAKWGGR